MESSNILRLVSQNSLRVNARANRRRNVGRAQIPIYIRSSQKNFASAEISIQYVAENPAQIAMEIKSKLNIKEPGAERRQAMIAAIREINAERIEKKG